MLAGLVLGRQGIETEWITFETPFFSSARARKASQITGIALTVENITPVYLKMLKNPRCGYGRHMNPCMDCHALMFQESGKIMIERGFDFLFSGEVLGQRPMSQTRPGLRYVAKQSGYDGYVLRPLSAIKLPETIPEKKGLVKREMLLDFSGRSRKPQIQLAHELGISEYPSPAGGCLLTDKAFAARLKDLFDHQDTYTEAELELLKHGRHLRLGKDAKIIVGRTQADNQHILQYHNFARDIVIEVEDYPGPIVLIPGGGNPGRIKQAAAICAGYSKAPNERVVVVSIEAPHGHETIAVNGIGPAEIRQYIL